MDEYCQNCGAKLKENAQFCQNCGWKVPAKNRFPSKKYLILIIIIVLISAGGAYILFSASQTQVVQVDNVKFEIPADYVSEPSRTDVSYDGNIKSSAMGWSNDRHYIEIGITRSPDAGINSREVIANLGGTPTTMFGHYGYYQKYDENSYSFVFGMKDKICMIYVSDYDAFDDIKIIEED